MVPGTQGRLDFEFLFYPPWLYGCQGIGAFVSTSVRWGTHTHLLGVLRGLNKINCVKCLPYCHISSGSVFFLSGRPRAGGDGAWPPSLAPGHHSGLASSSSHTGSLPKMPLVLPIGLAVPTLPVPLLSQRPGGGVHIQGQ